MKGNITLTEDEFTRYIADIMTPAATRSALRRWHQKAAQDAKDRPVVNLSRTCAAKGESRTAVLTVEVHGRRTSPSRIKILKDYVSPAGT
jgi:hypothetical protein